MSRAVVITTLGAKRYAVEVKIGVKTACRNLADYQVKAFVRNTIASTILRYYRHRKNILTVHGGYLTGRKKLALQNLQLKLSSHNKWQLDYMPSLILNMEADLYAIAPGVSSKFYANNSQLLSDLVAWARYANNNKIYGHIKTQALDRAAS